VRCGERTLALPLFAVESCLRLDSSAVQYAQNRATLAVGDRVLALWRLADILQLPLTSPIAGAQQYFVLMKVRGESFALAIDALLGDRTLPSNRLDHS
jgi:chemotaxis protein histidine kinase CheA